MERTAELQLLVCIDGLTQVANRRRFDEYLHQEWRRGIRERSPRSLILCDVDYFKLYNDRYGHQAGDNCLRAVARAISINLKRPGDLVARYQRGIICCHSTANGSLWSTACRQNYRFRDPTTEDSPCIFLCE